MPGPIACRFHPGRRTSTKVVFVNTRRKKVLKNQTRIFFSWKLRWPIGWSDRRVCRYGIIVEEWGCGACFRAGWFGWLLCAMFFELFSSNFLLDWDELLLFNFFLSSVYRFTRTHFRGVDVVTSNLGCQRRSNWDWINQSAVILRGHGTQVLQFIDPTRES